MTGFRRKNPANPTIFEWCWARGLRLLTAWRGGQGDDILSPEDREFSMRRRDFRSAVLVAAIMLLASPAFAQIPKLNLLQDKPGKTQEEKDAESAQEKAYKDSLKKIPDQKAPSDPWGGVRSDAPSSSPAKSASSTKPKTKSGTAASSGTSPN
jgi:hypothetical protein